jgi:LuxR family maltose regulon positive regulatory protein
VSVGEGTDGQEFMRLVSSGALLCIPIDDGCEWYRYHRLFQEFLQRQLGLQHAAGEIAGLHRRAAAWLEEQGLLEEAIPHLLAADGAIAAGELLARHHNPLLNREQRHRLDRCLHLLPADTVEDAVELLLMKAWLRYHQGRHLETPLVLDRIEALLERDHDLLDLHSALPRYVAAFWRCAACKDTSRVGPTSPSVVRKKLCGICPPIVCMLESLHRRCWPVVAR